MAENAPVLFGGENSPEQIAYKLLITISENEKKSLHPSGGMAGSEATADRKWLLDTYAECLTTVRNPTGRRPRPK